MRQWSVAVRVLLLLTVLLLAGQDGSLWRHRHHGRHCVGCVCTLRAGPPGVCDLRLAEVGDRGLVVHGGHLVSVERQAGRGALCHDKQEESGKEGQEESAGVKVAGVWE